MQCRRFLGAGTVAIALCICALGADADDADSAIVNLAELIAPTVAKPPLIDGRADDAAWFGAGRLSVPTAGGPSVDLRALVAEDVLYVLAQWADDTESVAKQTWRFDGTAWQPGREDEDRLAVMWPIGSAKRNMATEGCAFACHTEDPDPSLHGMWMPAAGLTADLWHWKSARTNPAGFADDQYLTYIQRPAKDGGRHNDPGGDAAYVRNASDDGRGPAFGFADTPRSRFLPIEEAKPLASLPPAAAGTLLPGFVVQRATDNRGDVRASGVWADGGWTLELKRAVDTGHPEDVRFVADELFPFALAVMDNGGGAVHKTSGPVALRITRPLDPPRLTKIYALLLAIGGLGIAGALGAGRA